MFSACDAPFSHNFTEKRKERYLLGSWSDRGVMVCERGEKPEEARKKREEL